MTNGEKIKYKYDMTNTPQTITPLGAVMTSTLLTGTPLMRS